MATTNKPVCCMNQVNHGLWCQESYESASGDARRRASQLRKLGYAVTVCSLGSQVTPIGSIRTTLVDIRPGLNGDTGGLPSVERIAWPR